MRLESNFDFSTFVQEQFSGKSSIEQEALALALGFHPQLKVNFKLKQLKEAARNQDLVVKRAALTGIAFSTLLDSKGGKKQKKLLKKFLNDPLTTTRLTAAIALGINAYFSEKLQKSGYNEFRKKIKKQDFYVKQGYSIGLGLLAKFPKMGKESFNAILGAYNPTEIGSPTNYLIGLTLTAINAERAEEGFDFIFESIIPNLSDKESRRIAMICCAFLFPLILDPEIRVEKLEKLIKKGIELHSKFGTDSALVLTYFSLLQDKIGQQNFLIRLLGLKDLDPDYEQIYFILKEKKKEIDILKSLLQLNTLDIKAAGITASFFLESESEELKYDLEAFIEEGLQQQASGYFDRFLILLRAFSFILLREDYGHADFFENFFHSNDQRVKRFAGLSYACLKAMNQEFQEVYAKIGTEMDEHVRWGLLVGISMYESVGTNILDDELILGLLLLCLGLVDVSTLLLISQAMISKYYQ